MKLNEVIQEFENDVISVIKEEVIENGGQIDPSVFFLVSDEDGNCDVVRKSLPPTPIETFTEPSFDGLFKMFFHKFIWENSMKEINDENKSVLDFIVSERVDLSDKTILSIVKKKLRKNENVRTEFYEIIENDIVISSDGVMKPSSVKLVEMEQD